MWKQVAVFWHLPSSCRAGLISAVLVVSNSVTSLAVQEPVDSAPSVPPVLAATAGIPAATASPSHESVPSLIEDLDADAFTTRRTASTKLFLLGKRAIPEIAEAAQNGSPEARSRALAVLRRHSTGDNAELSELAVQRLFEIASNAKTPTSIEARNILYAAKVNPLAPGFGGFPNPNARGNPAAGPGLKAGKSVNRVVIRSGENFRDIEIEDAERKVKIHESGDKQIAVEVTDKGKEKSGLRKLAAKTPEELKQEDEAAYRLYQIYQRPKAAPADANGRAQLAERFRAIRDFDQRLALREADFLRRLGSAKSPQEVESAHLQIQQIRQQRQQIQEALRGMTPQGLGLE